MNLVLPSNRSSVVGNVINQVNWDISKFTTKIEYFTELMSPEFSFFFPQVNKNVKLVLVVKHTAVGYRCANIKIVSRVPECFQLFGKLKIGTKVLSFGRKIKGTSCIWNHREAPSHCFHLDELCKEAVEGSLQVGLIIEDIKVLAKQHHLEIVDSYPSFCQAQRSLLSDTVFSDFMIECGQVLSEATPAGVNAIFESFRTILHDG